MIGKIKKLLYGDQSCNSIRTTDKGAFIYRYFRFLNNNRKSNLVIFLLKNLVILYLILTILGILSTVTYYLYFDVNILPYMSLLEVLLASRDIFIYFTIFIVVLCFSYAIFVLCNLFNKTNKTNKLNVPLVFKDLKLFLGLLIAVLNVFIYINNVVNDHNHYNTCFIIFVLIIYSGFILIYISNKHKVLKKDLKILSFAPLILTILFCTVGIYINVPYSIDSNTKSVFIKTEFQTYETSGELDWIEVGKTSSTLFLYNKEDKLIIIIDRTKILEYIYDNQNKDI